MNIKRIFNYYWEKKQYKIAIFTILILGSARILFSMIANWVLFIRILIPLVV